MVETVNWIKNNNEVATLVVSFIGVILTVIGWVAVFMLGLYQQKRQLQNTAKMKVYEELFALKKKIDDQSQGLGLLLGSYGLPFLQMSFQKNPSNKVESNSRALKLWQDYLSQLSESTNKFVTAYLEFWVHSDMWISALPHIKLAKEELFTKQLKDLTNSLYEHHRYLQDQSIHQFDWEQWDQKEIKNRSELIKNKFDEIAFGYVDDYIGLIHNFLVAPIFKHKKYPREGFANMEKLHEYYILTEEGLKKIVNKIKR